MLTQIKCEMRLTKPSATTPRPSVSPDVPMHSPPAIASGLGVSTWQLLGSAGSGQAVSGHTRRRAEDLCSGSGAGNPRRWQIQETEADAPGARGLMPTKPSDINDFGTERRRRLGVRVHSPGRLRALGDASAAPWEHHEGNAELAKLAEIHTKLPLHRAELRQRDNSEDSAGESPYLSISSPLSGPASLPSRFPPPVPPQDLESLRRVGGALPYVQLHKYRLSTSRSEGADAAGQHQTLRTEREYVTTTGQLVPAFLRASTLLAPDAASRGYNSPGAGEGGREGGLREHRDGCSAGEGGSAGIDSRTQAIKQEELSVIAKPLGSPRTS